MRYYLFAVFLLFAGCGNEKATPNLEIDDVIPKLSNPNTIKNIDQRILDDAQIMLNRSASYGYKLITSKELFQMLNSPIIILDVSLKGDYLLGHIQNAKNFTFTKEVAPPQQNPQWNENYGSLMQFEKKLGANQGAMIVVYDKGDYPLYQIGTADIACMWIIKLGYYNVYRLVGGFAFWKARNYPISREIPQCCEHKEEK